MEMEEDILKNQKNRQIIKMEDKGLVYIPPIYKNLKDAEKGKYVYMQNLRDAIYRVCSNRIVDNNCKKIFYISKSALELEIEVKRTAIIGINLIRKSFNIFKAQEEKDIKENEDDSLVLNVVLDDVFNSAYRRMKFAKIKFEKDIEQEIKNQEKNTLDNEALYKHTQEITENIRREFIYMMFGVYGLQKSNNQNYLPIARQNMMKYIETFNMKKIDEIIKIINRDI